jgi:hypothetical protein
MSDQAHAVAAGQRKLQICHVVIGNQPADTCSTVAGEVVRFRCAGYALSCPAMRAGDHERQCEYCPRIFRHESENSGGSRFWVRSSHSEVTEDAARQTAPESRPAPSRRQQAEFIPANRT